MYIRAREIRYFIHRVEFKNQIIVTHNYYYGILFNYVDLYSNINQTF